jgi:hypothetical protein
MNPKTLAALRGSIDKWRGIAEGTESDCGPANCPLCREFFYKTLRCCGCPVMEKTGKANCIGTPYVDWDDLLDSIAADVDLDSINNINDVPLNQRQRAIDAARAEQEFLESLLPEEGSI